MSSGYAACSADTIEEDDLKKIGKCGTYLRELRDYCEDRDIGFEEIAENIECNLDQLECEEIQIEKIMVIYNKLLKEFNDKTKLTLYLEYHNSEDQGSCYDDVEGSYWAVGGMYQLTDAGKKMTDVVSTAHFVSYG